MFTSSPESFYYAVEGYFDNIDELSELIRLQTFYLASSFGAKKKGGGDIRPQDLWRLRNEQVQQSPVLGMDKEQYKAWFSNLQKKYKIGAKV